MKGMTIAALLLAASTLAFAQPQERPRMGSQMRERHERLLASLHLTDQQETQIKRFHLQLERKQAEVQSKIRLARLDMKELFLSDKIDRTALEKSMKQVSDLQYQQKLNFVDFWFSVNSTLTPEQQKTWKQHLGQMGDRLRERMRQRMRERMMDMGPTHRGPMMPDPPGDNDD